VRSVIRLAGAALVLACLSQPACAQDSLTFKSPPAGDARIKAWLDTLGDGKLAEAAAGLTGDAEYGVDGTTGARTMAGEAFLGWLGRCNPSAVFNVPVRADAPGWAMRAFTMLCPPLAGSDPLGGNTQVGIKFFVGSDGKKVRIIWTSPLEPGA
jgi:hypothetical protein